MYIVSLSTYSTKAFKRFITIKSKNIHFNCIGGIFYCQGFVPLETISFIKKHCFVKRTWIPSMMLWPFRRIRQSTYYYGKKESKAESGFALLVD
jgi:hypothetical protein